MSWAVWYAKLSLDFAVPTLAPALNKYNVRQSNTKQDGCDDLNTTKCYCQSATQMKLDESVQSLL